MSDQPFDKALYDAAIEEMPESYHTLHLYANAYDRGVATAARIAAERVPERTDWQQYARSWLTREAERAAAPLSDGELAEIFVKAFDQSRGNPPRATASP